MKPGDFLLLLLFFCCFSATAQKTKAELDKQRQQYEEVLKVSARALEETKNRKETTTGQLAAIDNQISARQGLISTIEQEIRLLSNDVSETKRMLDAMNKDLEGLKKEYAEMLYQSSKINNSYNLLLFIFSSGSYNQMMARMRYVRQMKEARKTQVEQIEIVKNELQSQQRKLREQQQGKQQLLNESKKENEKLLASKQEQKEVLVSLGTKEKELRNEIKKAEDELKRLEKEIQKIIAASTASPGKIKLTPEQKIVGSSFAANRGRLGWPLQRCFIAESFGRHAHPTLRGVEVDVPGIELQTYSGESVKAVFEGDVVSVTTIPGMNKMVLIQHGGYFTAYARLKSVYVKRGQHVKAGEVLGEVMTDSKGVSRLMFQVWKGQEKMDPQQWLTR